MLKIINKNFKVGIITMPNEIRDNMLDMIGEIEIFNIEIKKIWKEENGNSKTAIYNV
jgi:hypothetical protein